jgi:hypothetical protein
MLEEGDIKDESRKHCWVLDREVECKKTSKTGSIQEYGNFLLVYLKLLNRFVDEQIKITMRILKKASLSSTVAKSSLIHSNNFIASLSPHLSLESIALTIASEPMYMEDDSFADRWINWVSIGHQHDFFSILHYSEF